MKRLFLFFALFSISAMLYAQPFINHTGNDYSLNNLTGYKDIISNDFTHDGEYEFIWYFSDGTWVTDSHKVTPTTATGNSGFVNAPSVSGAWCEYTSIYKEDDDEPEMRTNWTGVSPNVANNPATVITDFSDPSITQSVNLFYPISNIGARKGDVVTYVFQYKNNICDNQKLNTKIILSSTGNVPVTFLSVVNPFDKSEAILNTANNEVEIEVEDLDYGKHRTAFIQFRFEDIKEQSNGNIRIEFDYEGSPNNTCPSLVKDFPFTAKDKSDPHDPNLISSKTKWFCPKEIPNEIEFNLDFQNIGKGRCDTVIIRLDIPSWLKKPNPGIITSLPSGLHHVNNPSNINGIVWKLGAFNQMLKANNPPNHFLEGLTANPPPSVGSTRDRITFTLEVNQQYEFKACSTLPPMQADVYFDSEPMVQTNKFSLDIRCDDCSECENSKGPAQKLKPHQLSSSGKILDYRNLGDKNSSFYWSPEEGLSNPNIANPKFIGSQDQTYQLTVVKDCTKKVYQIPVAISAQSGANMNCCCWWIVGLLGFITLLLVIIVIRMPSNKRE